VAAESHGLPNPIPRPAGELEALERAWAVPRGIRALTIINNNYIGILYVGAGLLFFVLAGILALIMRTQLAVPENDLIGPELYNQLFTMHGTMMMFLFAVPIVEAMGVLLLPNMVGARDLPFPRLSAYAFWAYFVGGVVFFCSLFFGMAPDGGWFLYPPLTSGTYSPGINQEFWLLGIGFIEISAIAGAIEIIVGVLRTRAPGMSLGKMPIFAWAMLVFALMIVFAFPAVILATTLLELERAFDLPFFIADKGGDPLLWQHLFWFFGHPEVYIIFLPAAGMVSMIVPAMAQTPLAGYRWVVLALIATGFLSFGLWVHHMFATGIPLISLSFFQAASMAVAIPSGIQFFAWIATFAKGTVKICTPTLFVLGFLFVFLLGGLTGVMVAVVPFDWQVHDTYFIVAHLHYVLIGGMVFPLLAGLYYWMPYTSREALSERWGRWVFGLVFVGFNVAFFPMHLTGLAGMPRRVHSYPQGMGWDGLNLVSTIGAFMIAAGVLILLIDLARHFRMAIDENAGNVWNAGTLEWLPSGVYSTRSIPIVRNLYPLWQQPELAKDVEAGAYYLPGSATGGRETIVTSAVEARAQYILRMPMPGWSPLLGALFTAAFFLLLTFKLVLLAGVCGVVALAALVRWAWDLDPADVHGPVPIGGGIRLPVYASGPDSHAWWAMVILMLVSASLYGCLIFSYLYLWTVRPEMWTAAEPSGTAAAIAIGTTLLSSAVVGYANRELTRRDHCYALLAAIPTLAAGVWCGFTSFANIPAKETAYGAVVHTVLGINAFFAVTVTLMALYVVARQVAGQVNRQRRVSFDNARIFWHYTVAQSIAGLVFIHGFPRLVG
jgi:cytochrome c oxidase subunit I+III